MSIATDRKTILVVDDDRVILTALSTSLTARGFIVSTAQERSEALAATRGSGPDVIIIDVNFPREVGHGSGSWDGLALMSWIRQIFGNIPVIVISGAQEDDIRERAMAAGALRFFQKPVDIGELLVVVHEALSAHSIEEGTTA